MFAEGKLIPPGVTWEGNGWNFGLYCRHTTGVTLPLCDSNDFVKPVAVFKFDQLQDTCIAD
jgi:hypothetical protein